MCLEINTYLSIYRYNTGNRVFLRAKENCFVRAQFKNI